MKKLVLSVIAGAAILAAGCGTSLNFVPPATGQGGGDNDANLTQVEFLARPAIGEGLLFSNDLLNTYNAVTPRFVATALADPNSAEFAAASPVFNQATAVLDILTGLDPNNGPTTAQVVGAFLPDVMRIDTTLNFAPTNDGNETSAYGSQLNAAGSPVAGRKITDDVVDITLNYLTGGQFPAGDGVPYYDPGNLNEAIGHSPLNGETVQFGDSTFPYLAPPQ